jgi:hypothetical protein
VSPRSQAVAKVSAVPNAVPFKPGHDPRRAAGGMTTAEREFWREVEETHYPRASALLGKMIDKGMKGNEKAALVAFKVMGLIRKQTDAAQIQALAQQLLDGMLEEARARRAAGVSSGG